MKVTQTSIGRFHHFHLARQMERLNLLDYIYTAYPGFKLKDEQGIPKEKIKTFPWLHTPYMKRGKLGLDKMNWLNREWEWLDKQSFDKYVGSKINQPTILIALSGSGLISGQNTKKIGGRYICDRGSTHIRFQNDILTDEFLRWGFKYKGIDERVIIKEEKEYQLADAITVPSEFVRKSFIEKGILPSKIEKIMYGARLDRFKKLQDPPINSFRILWVGSVSIRKGFMYALQAFQKFKHPKKEFIVVGNVEQEIKYLMNGQDLSAITFLGNLPNTELPKLYSTAHAFLISSLEEGLAMVQGEALACGCPIIATTNSGSEDLINNEVEGFIVPIRSPSAILDKFYQLSDDPQLRNQMSENAIQKVKSLGGWDAYGNNFNRLIQRFITQ